MNEAGVDTLWYQTNLDVFLNRWYSNYEEAHAERENSGGFLLTLQTPLLCLRGGSN
jgi:hypothetical protein